MRTLIVIALYACGSSDPPRAPDVVVTPPALDVPSLSTTRGTLPLPEGAIVTLTGAADEVAHAVLPERGPALVAIGRAVPYRAVVLSLDAVHRAGVSEVGLVVTVARERRMLVIESRIPAGSTASIAVITAGAVVTFGDAPISLEVLPAAVWRDRPDRIVVVPDPEVSMQRLAEVIAASGGRVFLGTGTLPSVIHRTP